MFLANNLNKGGSLGGYQISRSLRFNSADSAYLNRTPASASNRKIWTWSAWVKRSSLNSFQYLLYANTASGTFSIISFGAGSSADQLRFQSYLSNSAVSVVRSTAVYRDPSAWYHIVVAVDTTQATDTNRIRMYVNGVEITSFAQALYPAQNTDLEINNNVPTSIGDSTASANYDGYMTEVRLIDGTQLTPSSFGETNAQTGVWQPKAYSGSYGTNGFYLNFSDNSNTTATTLGKDYSGNGNNWTPNNFSVSAGAGNDSLVDSPTSYGTDTGAGGTVRGNYATLNPLKKKSTATISNGNLALVATSAAYVTGLSTISPSSGTYYMEMVCSGSNSNRPWGIGMVETTAADTATIGTASTYFVSNNSGSTVNYFVAASTTALSTSSTWVAGDIISLAWNVDSGKFWVGRNGVWYPSSTGGTVASNSDVAAGNYPTFTISYSGNTNPQVIPAFVTYDTTASIDANFGQRPFAYTAPSGYKALCTQNLPTPTIGATTATQAGKYFNTITWSGDSVNPRTLTGVGFQPDLVWAKGQSIATSHFWQDAVRGVTSSDTRSLSSNSTSAETNYYPTNGGVTAFTSDGFTTSGGSTNLNLNYSGYTFVAWNWKANGSGSTNTAGSITSTVSANTTSGFSIVTFTGVTGGGTVGHGLGVAPSMIIVKSRNNVVGWVTYHASLGADKYLLLNTTDSVYTNTSTWKNTAPTSTVFSVGDNAFPNTWTEVAYCFAEVAGYSKFGSYTGNGSADGPFVFTGMRPAYIVVKRTNSSGTSWNIYDTTRSPYNVTDDMLFANLSDAELANETSLALDILSNGFKLRTTGSSVNGSGDTYIFMAFASAPLKYALAR